MSDHKADLQPDRRTQRTQQTLLEALIELLRVKHYDAISVKDIIEKANVGRSTFYAHFQTKDDLLRCGFERVLDLLLEQVDLDATRRNLTLDTVPLFRHARGHAELYHTLAWGSGFEVITTQGVAALGAKFEQRLAPLVTAPGEQPAVPLSALCYSLAGSLLLLLKWWLENGMPGSPESMDAIFQQLVMPGMRNTLGLA